MAPAAEMASAELDAGSALERGSRCPEGERVVEGRNSGNHISLLDVDDLKRRWIAITEKAGKGRVVLRRPQKAVVGKMDPMVADLLGHYRRYCELLDVKDLGDNLDCAQQLPYS